MSGIYLHIPFCKKACHYCDFHFSTSLKRKEEMIDAIIKEIILRKEETREPIETIYFGGGTPSLLETDEIIHILDAIYSHYEIIENPEITLEANPDDLTKDKIISLANTQINRLSIGIQSFKEADLTLMNRAHKASEAENCLAVATNYFDNITIDLIYGIPNLTDEEWIANIDKAINYGINHISSYALTVEPNTAYEKLIRRGKLKSPNDERAAKHFDILVEKLEQAGFLHYELSNFGKEGYISKHNTSYWKGKTYIGVGPSAHSYNKAFRSWNINNNVKYIKALENNSLPNTKEELSEHDIYNEYIMTGLRTTYGVDLKKIEKEFSIERKKILLEEASKHIDNNLLIVKDNILRTTKKGKFLCDGIASDLFII